MRIASLLLAAALFVPACHKKGGEASGEPAESAADAAAARPAPAEQDKVRRMGPGEVQRELEQTNAEHQKRIDEATKNLE